MKRATLIQFYSSPNGDTWFLGRGPTARADFIRHKANVPSGGYVTDTAIDAFLNGPRNAEHEALLALIGTAISNTHGADTAVERNGRKHRLEMV